MNSKFKKQPIVNVQNQIVLNLIVPVSKMDQIATPNVHAQIVKIQKLTDIRKGIIGKIKKLLAIVHGANVRKNIVNVTLQIESVHKLADVFNVIID